MRLVGKATDVYQYLEPLYNDYRKLRRKLSDGSKLKRLGSYLALLDCFIWTVVVLSYFCCFSLMFFSSFAGFALSHVDEFIDELLTKDYSCDIALPRVPKR